MKKIVSIILCLTLILSLADCPPIASADQNRADSYVKEDGTVVVDGVEIRDAFVKLQVDTMQMNEISLEGIDVEEILVNCATVTEITVLETEVVPLNDEFVYLAYQNFVSYYDEDIDFWKFLEDVAIGGICIIVYVTLSTVNGPIGTFFGAVITSEFAPASLAIGAALDAAYSGYLAYREGGDASYIVGHMFNGVADDFKWTAMLAPVSGSVSGIRTIHTVSLLKKVNVFAGMSDETINALLTDFIKIVKKTTKETADMSDDALKALYRQMSAELSSEITEEVFISAVRNQSDIIRYILEYDSLDSSRKLVKALQERFLSKAGLSDDAIKKYIKQIQNKTIKCLDDITEESLQTYIKDNMYEFVETFGKSLSNNFIDDCLREKLGKDTFDAIKKCIATDDNAYCTLIETIGKEVIDSELKGTDTLILLQRRYGSKNVNKLFAVSELYSDVAGNGLVEHGTVAEIINGIIEGDYKTIEDIRKISAAAADNLIVSRNALHEALCVAERLKKNADLLADIVSSSLSLYIDDEDDAIRAMVQKNFSKNEVIEESGQPFYNKLVNNADQVIQNLALQPQMNISLIRELFIDSLSAEGLSDEVIELILSGVPLSEWGLSDPAVKRIANRVATYYQKTDINCYINFIMNYSELRASAAKAYKLKNGCLSINGNYAGQVMATDNDYIKEKYGDVYMDGDGYPIFDQYAIARVEFNNLTGSEISNAKKANMYHHGSNDTPQGYTWHDVGDGRTMILVPSDLHDAYEHSRRIASIENGADAICPKDSFPKSIGYSAVY